MSQTKFVLMKALKNNLTPIVVLNKVDRDSSRLANNEVANEIYELFMNLEATDAQLDFPLLYASAREGWAVHDMKDPKTSLMAPLLDTIVKTVPPPMVQQAETSPFSMLVSNIESDNFVGRVMRGRVYSGTAKVGDKIHVLQTSASKDGSKMLPEEASKKSSSSSSSSSASELTSDGARIVEEGRITKIFCNRGGLARQELTAAVAGDIVCISGVKGSVNDTISHPTITVPIPALPLDPPTIAMTFSVHDSPVGGREGKFLTSALIRDRLVKEAENNVAIALKTSGTEAVEVHGRGELQLGILIETMRREGFEISVSPPRVLFKRNEEGRLLEPIEEVIIDVDESFVGSVIEKVQSRGGEMLEYKNQVGKTRLVFLVPSRGLLGYSSEIKTDTRGTAVLNSIFHAYKPFNEKLTLTPKFGKMISMAAGKATGYALNDLQERGTLFVSPGDVIYEGMIVGECSKAGDLEVNPVRAKKVTNVRTKIKDDNVILTPPKVLSLEELISYVSEGEVIDVTPTKLRLRSKKISK